MIKVYHYKGDEVILNENEIVSIQKAGVSSRWHGILTFIHMTNGKVIESSSSFEEIDRKIFNG